MSMQLLFKKPGESVLKIRETHLAVSCLMSMQSMSQVTKLVSSCEEGICSRSVRLSRSSRLDMSEVDMEDGVVGCCCKGFTVTLCFRFLE